MIIVTVSCVRRGVCTARGLGSTVCAKARLHIGQSGLSEVTHRRIAAAEKRCAHGSAINSSPTAKATCVMGQLSAGSPTPNCSTFRAASPSADMTRRVDGGSANDRRTAMDSGAVASCWDSDDVDLVEYGPNDGAQANWESGCWNSLSKSERNLCPVRPRISAEGSMDLVYRPIIL